ncbi:nickel pincer cofactor biosynthesis protein LarC [Candidatus Aerophobetes bacterium]|uniref:Putative nickel insertion protein n=1 Tax=Aerophobetes bacterium TaxID=2030807 RepID=A0A523YS16_UNCAE|nr:MAG: nickel pincer cofactor biosynthesis protein LarC [Candidatus Aerophobetes bacterium]
MRAAYFDCFSGISGDMVLGALVDLGWPVEELKRELDKLDLFGYRIEAKKVAKRGIFSTQIKIRATEEKKERTLEDILSILDKSKLEEKIKERSRAIFTKIASVEAKIHGKDVQKIHFHELGGLDTIIDVVGAVAGMNYLGVEKVYSSPLPLGKGFVKCSHGILPVPAPATLELLKEVPVYGSDIEAELVTPTGAAIISNLAENFGQMPPMKIEHIGYGAGQRDLPIPNLLRVSIGVIRKAYEEDVVSLIQTNIDDMNPELYEHIVDRLFHEGALDVFLTPIQMKRTRPATMLSVIADEEKMEKMLEIIFDETTTLGIRISKIKRRKLNRENRKVSTKYGKIEVKIGKHDGVVKNISPSYEECRKIATHLKIPLKKVYQEAKQAAFDLLEKRT